MADLTQAVPMLVVGALAHAGFGAISVAVVVSLLIGQIPGVWLGAKLSSTYDGHALRWLLMAILAATAASWGLTATSNSGGWPKSDHVAPPSLDASNAPS